VGALPVFCFLLLFEVLLDGPGTMKLTNFCLSRLQNESLADVYSEASGQLPDDADFVCDPNILKGETIKVLK